jgi:hypothetical protein
MRGGKERQEVGDVRFGQKQTFCDARAMSALPPKADICSVITDVR